MKISKNDILQHFRANGKPLSFRALSENLGLPKKYSRTLKRVLREMTAQGDIIRTRKGMYGPSKEMSIETGYFEAHRDGYGFVILEKPGEKDIFVPARATRNAMNNDRVMVSIVNRNKREGRIVRILERAYSRIAGTIEVDGRSVFLRPKNRNINFDVYIPFNMKGKARNGDSAVVEITSFPSDKRPPSGKVVKIIDVPDDPRGEIEAIIDEMSLPRRFPRNVSDASKELEKRADNMRPDKRRDLTSLNTVTIDGETAKDFDDAISIERIDDGYRLYVHIADVGHYVKWNDVIDMEARNRGTSVYFPDRVLPMLPKALSENLCSLRPGVKRLAFTAEMDLDERGITIDKRFYPSIIKSNRRMTYTSVAKILIDRDVKERKKCGELLADLELMEELARIIRAGRMKRGSLDFDLPEPEIILDLQGNLENICTFERNFAHMLIEEFMILANEAVSEHIESMGLPSLYRVHEEPDETKLVEILAALRGLTNIRKHKLKAGDVPRILKTIKGLPAEDALNYIVLRGLKQARYSTDNIGHYGLASKSYTHFTSPIRRYPDLVVHRILREIVKSKDGVPDKKIKAYETLLPDIALHSSRMERLSDDAEREVLDAMRAWFMKDKVGDEFRGRITGIAPYGIKIRLNDYYVEGFMHISDLTDDFYFYNEADLTFTGRHTKRVFRIGDELNVLIQRVDLHEREIVYGLA
ncbi:MAG: ribonuclease R [Nitrospirota bacterium]|nr:MAG: ribonuclease R [Nitrospirota bacterium]